METCMRPGCAKQRSGTSPFCSLDCLEDATECANNPSNEAGTMFHTPSCTNVAGPPFETPLGVYATQIHSVYDLTNEQVIASLDDTMKEKINCLSSDDQELALSLMLDPNTVSSTSIEVLCEKANNLIRVGEQLGVKVCPIMRDHQFEPRERAILFRVHLDDRMSNTGKWWFVWGLEDPGWHSIPRGLQYGCQVFSSCRLMTCLVLNPELQLAPLHGLDMHGKDVLELGSGVGMLGITAATMARRTVITDGDLQSLHLARVNAKLNGEGRVQVKQLCWGRKQAASFRDEFGRFDRIIGSDIVYAPEAAQPLFETAAELLTTKRGSTFTWGWVVRTSDDPAEQEAIATAASLCGFIEVGPPVSLIQILTPVIGTVILPEGDVDILLYEFERAMATMEE